MSQANPGPMPDHTIETTEALRERYGWPQGRGAEKQMPRLDKHARAFIALSPFLVIASATSGGADASPKGDPPGFVKALDDATLLIPDRPGNNRVDTMGNLMENPHVGLIFFVPGMNETLRVNGRARVTTDPALLAPCEVRGRMPLSGLLVEVEEVYMHCAKAMIRSKLWDPSRHIDRKSFPTLGQIFADQIGGLDPEETNADIEARYRDNLY